MFKPLSLEERVNFSMGDRVFLSKDLFNKSLVLIPRKFRYSPILSHLDALNNGYPRPNLEPGYVIGEINENELLIEGTPIRPESSKLESGINVYPNNPSIALPQSSRLESGTNVYPNNPSNFLTIHLQSYRLESGTNDYPNKPSNVLIIHAQSSPLSHIYNIDERWGSKLESIIIINLTKYPKLFKSSAELLDLK